MSWIKELLSGLAGEVLGDLVGEVLVPALLVLVILILALPFYFIRKKMTGSTTTLREDLWESFINPPRMRPTSPFVEELDKVRSGFETGFLYLLYGVIALVTGFVIYFFRTLPNDPNKAFLQFYFGAGYLVFMLFAVGQVLALRSGRRRGRRRGAPGATLISDVTRSSGARAHEFSFEFGSAPSGGTGLQFRMGLSSPPVVEKLDNDTLDKAEQSLAAGGSLETVCRFINPRFGDLSRPMQEAYQQCLRQALELDERRPPHAEAVQPELVTAEPGAGSATGEAPKPAAAFTVLKLSVAQLMVAVMVFVAALAAFLSRMILWPRIGG
jgi:hypothetical protein